MAKKPAVAAKQEEKAPEAGTAVATQGGGEMILVGDKRDLSHIKTGTQRGSEGVSQEDVAVPRLEVLQSVSPQLDAKHASYIGGAKAGDLINSVTGENYGPEVFLVNVTFVKQWLVWRDRKKGGGFFGAFKSPLEAEERMLEVPESGGTKEKAKEAGLEVLDTPTHLCLLVNRNAGTLDEIMVSMPRTKAKVSRQWNAMIRLTGQDRFARVYRVTTAQETNKRNETYYNFAIAQCGAPAKILYQRAEALYQSIAKGRTFQMDTKDFDAGGEADPEGTGAAASGM